MGMLIDLSMQLDNDTPVYPGDPHIQLSAAGDFADAGYVLHMLTVGTHSGTHIDAPAHMLADGATLGSIPLESFIGRAKVVEGYTLAAAQAADLQSGDIAIFYSGRSEQYTDPTYFTDYPVMDTAVAEYLVEAGVKLVGVDTCSVDITEDFPIHHILLGAGIPLVENLVNIAALRGKECTIMALPLRIDADGAPARVIAEVA
jgi:kynurenine formamidase